MGYMLRQGGDHRPFLVVEKLVSGGPAARAGLRVQDLVIAIDGEPVCFRDESAALNFFRALRSGQ